MGCSWHLPSVRFFHFLSSQREFQFNSVVEKHWCWVRLMVPSLSNPMAHTDQTGEDMVLQSPPPSPPLLHSPSSTGSENCVVGGALGKIPFLSSDLFILFTGDWSEFHLLFFGSCYRNKSPGSSEHAQSAPRCWSPETGGVFSERTNDSCQGGH